MTETDGRGQTSDWQRERRVGAPAALDEPGLSRPSDWQRLRLSAIGVVVCLLSLGLVIALAPSGMTARSLQTPGAEAVIAEGPAWALAFYLGDSLYVLIAFLLFLILARLARGPRWLILAGLAAAFGKAGFDLAENLTFGLSAWGAWQEGVAEPVAAETAVLLTTLKRIAGGLTVLAFAPLYPGSDRGARLVRALLWLGAAATAAGFLLAALQEANAMLLFFTAVVIAWHAKRHASH